MILGPLRLRGEKIENPPHVESRTYKQHFGDSSPGTVTTVFVTKIPMPDVVLSMKMAIYARVSLRDGRQDVDNQLRVLREYAQKEGHQVTREYIDHASGKDTHGRKQFQTMLEDAAKGRFSLLVFYAVDRLGRGGALETLQTLQRLTACGVGYKSIAEPYLDSVGPFSDVVVSLLACVARTERSRLIERTLLGLARARAQGRVGGRRQSTNADEVKLLVASGLSLGEVSRRLGVSKTSIFRALRRG
jgi:DNA invertase Pin-like site-specific DNA recombinase